MLTTIKGAVRKMSSSIMEKYGSPIGSWGDLRERSPRTNGTAYTTARKNTPQAAALPMVRCCAVKPSWDMALLLVLLAQGAELRSTLRERLVFCPLLDAQHALTHHDNVRELHQQVEEDRRRDPMVVH